ncbi:MAG TPA: alcohol dehydrogenase catalytic domain-containing protein [Microbacteriaceae bacterium]|nr:alcohol dehydrogenase catalytic domain-containing protein [Microbacteriaceae bacterium]
MAQSSAEALEAAATTPATQATDGRRTLPTTMRAAVLGGPGQISVTTKPVPQVGPEDVLVRVRRATLCGTDLNIRSRAFFGGDGPAPGTFTPGHEYAGEVVALGESVDEFAIGDRVVAEAHRGCMRCTNCLIGQYTDCLNNGITAKGHRTQGMTVDGGFAEYVVNHVATLHRLPDSISFDEAAALTTAGTVMHALDVLRSLVVGASVAVIGPGSIGLLCVQVLRELGAGFIALSGTRPERLAIGGEYGAHLLIDVAAEDPIAVVRRATGGRGVDIVLECSGAGVALDQALGMVRRGGDIVLVGFFNGPVAADLNAAVMNGVTLHTVRGEGAQSVARAVSLAGQGRIRTAELITHHFPLEQIDAAFDAYANRTDGAIKVMIDI